MENNAAEKTHTSKHHYFVDEGGDATLFNRKGKVVGWHQRLLPFLYRGYAGDSKTTSITMAHG